MAAVPALSRADTFGSGANSFEIEFVRIGNPGNPPDDVTRPPTFFPYRVRRAGAVPYPYRIGKYEISEQLIDKANALGGLGITKDTRGPDKPATCITWIEAARFVNWLNTSTGHAPAYNFVASGDRVWIWPPTEADWDAGNLFCNKRAKYFLPSFDEWHKAAYYDPVADNYWDYPTSSDAIPDGIDFFGDPHFDAVFDDGANQLGPNDIFDGGKLNSYGVAAQGGNVEI
jgi:formylglycine-generating enzyme required for sulfatase activity